MRRQIEICFCRPLRLFPKHVQHVDRFGQLGDVDCPECSTTQLNTQFENTFAN